MSELAEKQWYIATTYSGHETKVADNIKRRIESMNLQEYVFRVVVAEEEILVMNKDGSQAYVEVDGILLAGTTTITLTNNAITTDSKFDFYTSIYGVSPTNVAVAAGSITLTFDAQETNMNVEVRVM